MHESLILIENDMNRKNDWILHGDCKRFINSCVKRFLIKLLLRSISMLRLKALFTLCMIIQKKSNTLPYNNNKNKLDTHKMWSKNNLSI